MALLRLSATLAPSEPATFLHMAHWAAASMGMIATAVSTNSRYVIFTFTFQK